MLVSAATELSEQQGSEVHRAHGAYVRKLMRLRRLMRRAAHARACTALTHEQKESTQTGTQEGTCLIRLMKFRV